MRRTLPTKGTDWNQLAETMTELRASDVDWRNGRAAVYVFHSGDDVMQVAHDAYSMFIAENGLGPAAFPSIRQMEKDVIDMALGLQHAPPGAAGSMTSGGTESIILALKACRDYSWDTGKVAEHETPEIVIPYSAHPAFDKGAHLLGLKVNRVPLNAELLADVEQMARVINDNTILIVGSAPCFPYGLMDPIEQLGELALAKDIWLHVDACVGGYVAPFVNAVLEADGEPGLPAYNFQVPGVRSMSADLHKYGYAAKGASTVLYADKTFRDSQVFHFEDWPCGHMFTPTFAGTRPGGAIAAAWAVMNYLGFEGYCARARQILEARGQLEAGLTALGLQVFGAPQLSIVAFGAEDLDILAVGEGLYSDGWFSSRVRRPDGIQCMLSPEHVKYIPEYLAVLGKWVAKSRAGELKRGSGDIAYS